MISILIPIYNYNVVKLVKALKKQCDKLKIHYQILCFDDYSDPKFKHENSLLSDFFNVNYTELSENLGRAKIRNWLAKSSSYENLLFLDCDSKIVSKTFIEDYLKFKDDADLISGGRVYSKKPPRAKSKILHWRYGVRKESKSAKYRSKNAISHFHSNNFLIKSEVLKKIKFDESIKGYGYEDILFAHHVSELGFKIKHIDNPVEHLGLEKAKDFITKTEAAISNLIELKYNDKSLNTKLERTADFLLDKGLKRDFMYFTRNRIDSIKSNLLSHSPKMRFLDIFKLYTFYEKRDEMLNNSM